MLRRINLSAAIIVLVCFFLPWVKVSCAGASDNLSGLDLARQDSPLLWLVPLLVGAVLVFGLLRIRRASPQIIGVLGSVCGVVITLLLNRERGRAHASGLIAPQLTGWFWLAFISAIVMVITAVGLVLRGRKAPDIGFRS